MITATSNPNNTVCYIDGTSIFLQVGLPVVLTFASTLGSITSITSIPGLPTGLTNVNSTIQGTPTARFAQKALTLSFSTGESVTYNVCIIDDINVVKTGPHAYRISNYSTTKTYSVMVVDANDIEADALYEITLVPGTEFKVLFPKDAIYLAKFTYSGSTRVIPIFDTTNASQCQTDQMISVLCNDVICGGTKGTSDQDFIYSFNKLNALRGVFNLITNPEYNHPFPYSSSLLDSKIADYTSANEILSKITKTCNCLPKCKC